MRQSPHQAQGHSPHSTTPAVQELTAFVVETHKQCKHSDISRDKGKLPEEGIPGGVLGRVTSVLDYKRKRGRREGFGHEGTCGHLVFLTQRWDSGGWADQGAQQLGKLEEIAQDSQSLLLSQDSLDGHSLTLLLPVGGETAPLCRLPSALPRLSLPAAQLDGGP